MTITLSGLASGLDVRSMIDGLVAAARTPVDRLSTQKQQLDAAAQTVSNLSTKLGALKSASLALSTPTGFSSFAATSSDATAVVATATGTASSTGSYAVNVTQLAGAQKSYSGTFASATTALNQAGDLSFTVAGKPPVTIAVAAGDSLTSIATKIASSGARLGASVIQTTAGARLVVQGLDSGATNGFTVGQTGSVSLGITSFENARDATFTVDGMAMSSPTNQISDAIAGVKLVLTKTTTSAATVSLASDPTALRAKVQSFVTAYNDYVSASHNAAGYAGNKAPNAKLASDPSIRTSLRRLAAVVGQTVAGTSGRYTTLASVGIATKRDGTLSFDTAKLDAAVSADPVSVARLFVTDASVGATGAMKSVMTAIEGLTVGSGSTLQARIDSLGTQSRRIGTTIVRMERQLDDYEAQLQKQFTAMDNAISKYNAMSNAIPKGTTDQ